MLNGMEIIIKSLEDLNLDSKDKQEDLYSKQEIKMMIETIFILAGFNKEFIIRVLNCLNESFKLSKNQLQKFYREVKNR